MEDADIIKGEIEIYPNPTSDFLNVKTEDLTLINIYNVNGQLIQSYNSDDDVMIVDVSDLEKGIYVIEGVADENRRINYFIKK